MVRLQRPTAQVVRLSLQHHLVFNPRRPASIPPTKPWRVRQPACMMTPRALRDHRGIPTGVLYDMLVGGGPLPWTLTVCASPPLMFTRLAHVTARSLFDYVPNTPPDHPAADPLSLVSASAASAL
jgi:hypothetical protein